MPPSKPPNRRRDNRLTISLRVIVTYEDGRSEVLNTRNMSTKGLFLEKGENEIPEVGTVLHVQVSAEQGLEAPPVVKARVTRKNDEGFGILFLDK